MVTSPDSKRPDSLPSGARSEPGSGERPRTAADPAPLVLVVDDFDDNRALYALTVAEAGYPVEEACDGAEALAKIGTIRPAVIVMDLSMPNVDGWEATRRLKADPRTADIVIIAVTGHATNFGLQRARDVGADAVLTKPCEPKDLLGMIALLLRDREAG